MAIVREFAPKVEVVTATFVSPQPTGESYGPPIAIGHYPGNNDEIWIEHDGARSNIRVVDVPAFIAQLRRAAKCAAAEKESE